MKSVTYSPYDRATRKLKAHIFRAFRMEYKLTKPVFEQGYIDYKGKAYLIVHSDSLEVHFNFNSLWVGDISFQEHQTGRYAVVGEDVQ